MTRAMKNTPTSWPMQSLACHEDICTSRRINPTRELINTIRPFQSNGSLLGFFIFYSKSNTPTVFRHDQNFYLRVFRFLSEVGHKSKGVF